MEKEAHKIIKRAKDRYPKNMQKAFLLGLNGGCSNPYNNTKKLNGTANYGKAFSNAFNYGRILAKRLNIGQQTINFNKKSKQND